MHIFIWTFILSLITTVGASAQSIAAMAEVLSRNTYGASKGDNRCENNPQTLSFSADLKTMTYVFADGLSATYNILYWSEGSFTSIIEGEERKTDAGDLVVWQLKLAADESFCWRRTDWPSYACTAPWVPCAGNS